SHFDEFEPAGRQLEHATLRHIDDGLIAALCIVTAERHLLDFLDELPRPAFTDDLQFTVLDGDFEATDSECTGVDDGAGVLANVDKTAAAIETSAEAARVYVAFLVALGHAEARHVEAAAVVEIEHLVLIDDRVRVG